MLLKRFLVSYREETINLELLPINLNLKFSFSISIPVLIRSLKSNPKPRPAIAVLTLKRDFKALVALEKTLDIKGYVLGLPLNTDGSTNKRTHKTREFGLYFSQYTDQPLLYIDESHSTQEARSHLKEAALKTKKHKHYLDKLAAQIILERYLLEARKLKASS